MHKSQLIDALCALFVLSVILIITLFAVCEDALFFHSDTRSVLVVSTAFGLALALALAAIGLALTPVARARRAMPGFVLLGIPSLIVGAITLFVFDLLQEEFQIFGFLPGGYNSVINVALALGCAIWVARVLTRHHGRGGIEARVARLSRVAAPVLLVLLIGFVVHGRSAHASGAEPHHVVLIVLDGWPADYLYTYNPDAPRRPVDGLFANAKVFRGMHTNATWTHGYFGALYLGATGATYTGRARLGNAGRGAGGVAPGWNLWSALQDLGVTTRWVTFHQNGIPESRAVSSYRGFRSIHLTHRHARVLHALGLEYDLVLCGPAARKMVVSPRRRVLFNLLNPVDGVHDALADVLLPEMRELQQRSDRTFLLFHTGWTAGPVNMPAAWDDSSQRTEREQLVAKIKQNDNRYDAAEEWYAGELRTRTASHTDTLGVRIENFIAALRGEGMLEHTTVMLTADHGHMYDRGRFWYGFHPDEEVARVPFVVFDAGGPVIDNSLRETIDITRTLVEIFGGEFPASRAAPLFAAAEKPFTMTATLRSTKHHEWFLVLYRGDEKVAFNLEPGSAGECVRMRAGANQADATTDDPDAFEAMRPYLRTALDELGVSADEVNARYRDLISR